MPKLYTIGEAEKLPGWHELDEGRLIPLDPPKPKHGWIASRIAYKFWDWVDSGHTGDVYVESGYVLHRDPDTLRGPDVSYMRRVHEGDDYWQCGPDLAVEVMSPKQSRVQFMRKIQQYLQAGSSLVWFVEPRKKQVTVYKPNGVTQIFGIDDTLSGENIMPGFTLPVRDILPSR